MRRKQRILATLEYLYSEQQQMLKSNNQVNIEAGITAQEIAAKLDIWRSNCSSDLNDLVRIGSVQKISGRPVRYIPVSLSKSPANPMRLPAEVTSNEEPPSDTFTIHSLHSDHPTRASDLDALSSLDGAQHSLFEVISRAKIALQYPPHGMHALLLGETGVGKSTFARRMHAYAIENKLLPPNAPFISFNCAEYASNPQILLDHLFGHVQGAYTGATADKVGLVESAHNGILFLDEVHRLPPEGQEMLFQILDYGEFKKLGETNKTRRTRFLLLAATTEMPESTLLRTFQRRIPMVLRLPSLRDWFMRDRYALIYKLFYTESKATNCIIRVTRAALMRLLYARFTANIGDLINVIRTASAVAYAEIGGESGFTVDVYHLNIAQIDQQGMQLMESMAGISDMVVNPLQQAPVLPSELREDSIYIKLDYLTQNLSSLGFESEEIGYVLEREIQRSYASSIEYSREELSRFVGSNFYDWLTKAWSRVEAEIDSRQSEILFIRLSMHLFGIISEPEETLSEQPSRSLLERVQSDYRSEYDTALKFTEKFSEESGVKIPEYEIPIISLMLRGDVSGNEQRVYLCLIMRGTQVAEGMAQTAQDIAGTTNFPVKVINVPVSETWTWIREQLEKALESVPPLSDILIMTDIPEVSEHVENSSKFIEGHQADTFFRPDTTDLLHALLSLASVPTASELVRVLKTKRAQHWTPHINKGKSVILACCLTGRGTAKAMKRLVEDILPKQLEEQIVVKTMEVGLSGQPNRRNEENIIATVGSINPQIEGVPFFSVEEAMTDRGVRRLLNVIFCASSLPIASEQVSNLTPSQHGKDYEEHVLKILDRDLLYVNPKVVLQAVKKMFMHFTKHANRDYTKEFAARFYLHVAYVIERTLRNATISHPYTAFIRDEFPKEWAILIDIWLIVGETFNIEAPVDEIAYLFEFLFPDLTIEVFE